VKLNKRNNRSEENRDRWMTTYSDMITLLLVFFVLLYSMSVIDLRKFRETAMGFSIAFGTNNNNYIFDEPQSLEATMNQIETSPVVSFERFAPPIIRDIEKVGYGWEIEQREEEQEEQRKGLSNEGDAELIGIARGLKENITREGLDEHVNILIEGGRLVIRIETEGVLFESGSAQLTNEVKPLLNIIADSLKFYRGLVMVEGHTDNVPIHTAKYPSNWELSTSRAVSVLKYWIDNQMMLPGDVVAAGYADTKPIGTNDNAQGRAKNRRVEILVLSRDEARTITR